MWVRVPPPALREITASDHYFYEQRGTLDECIGSQAYVSERARMMKSPLQRFVSYLKSMGTEAPWNSPLTSENTPTCRVPV